MILFKAWLSPAARCGSVGGGGWQSCFSAGAVDFVVAAGADEAELGDGDVVGVHGRLLAGAALAVVPGGDTGRGAGRGTGCRRQAWHGATATRVRAAVTRL